MLSVVLETNEIFMSHMSIDWSSSFEDAVKTLHFNLVYQRFLRTTSLALQPGIRRHKCERLTKLFENTDNKDEFPTISGSDWQAYKFMENYLVKEL